MCHHTGGARGSLTDARSSSPATRLRPRLDGVAAAATGRERIPLEFSGSLGAASSWVARILTGDGARHIGHRAGGCSRSHFSRQSACISEPWRHPSRWPTHPSSSEPMQMTHSACFSPVSSRAQRGGASPPLPVNGAAVAADEEELAAGDVVCACLLRGGGPTSRRLPGAWSRGVTVVPALSLAA